MDTRYDAVEGAIVALILLATQINAPLRVDTKSASLLLGEAFFVQVKSECLLVRVYESV